MSWFEDLDTANRAFTEAIDVAHLPTRQPGPQAVFTCMDPRVNAAAVGVPSPGPQGQSDSSVRIVRTLGGLVDDRSLAALIYVAGTRDVLVLTHTDCGAMLAHQSIGAISEQMADRLDATRLAAFRSSVGEDVENLRGWLRTFEDPEQAAMSEVSRVRSLHFVPQDVSITGAIYDVATGRARVVGH